MINRFSGMLCTLVLAGAAVAAACGGGEPQVEAPPPPPPATTEPAPAPAPTPAPAEPAPAPTPAPPPTAATPPEPPKPLWKDMTFDQKKAHMQTAVMGKMGPLLTGFDPKEFKEVTCATCHGKDGEKNKFKMPNAKLPKLDPKDNFKKHVTGKDAAMTKFMMEKVTPEMLALLPGATLYDPGTQKGFGCFSCHTMFGAK